MKTNRDIYFNGGIVMLILVYDKQNKQKDYMYMAKDMEDNYVIGYIVVEKPWYSSEVDWNYYIVKNEYGKGGMCGGALDLGMSRTLVQKDTIQPFTQSCEVIHALSIGETVRIDKKFYAFDDDAPQDNIVRYIRKCEDMEGLWDR